MTIVIAKSYAIFLENDSMSENSQAVSNNQVTSSAQTVGAYSINQFCELYSISRAHFYNLKADKLAPATFKAGKRTLISVDAAIRWCKDMEVKTAQASA